MAVAEGCPAFKQGCPFTDVAVSAIPEVMASVAPGVADKCPAFEEGCPFKESDSVEALYNKMSEMPATHRVGESTVAAKVVEQTLRKVHEVSKERRDNMQQECPVFATSCPFKTVTSDGEPLVQQLDAVLANWDLDVSEAPKEPAKQSEMGENGPPLSSSLKAGTKSVHRAAENVRFVRDFLKGAVPKESYIALLKALYHVYSTLERALDTLPEHMKHVDFGLLKRAATLEADIRHHAGQAAGAKFDAGPPSQAAAQYVERLHTLAKEEPYLLLAHAYTRYLGDLSGGQILARSATKAYNLSPGGGGTEFYAFDQIGSSPQDLKAFKKSYRASLDALRLPTQKADALVAEAGKAFCMNMLIFEERDVAAGHIDRVRTIEEVLDMVQTNKSALAFQQAYGAPAPSGKCPFLPSGGGAADGQGVGPARVCPWPFIWMHDPKIALVMHPVKNVGGVIAILGLMRAAWYEPRKVGLGLATTGVFLALMKPKKKSKDTGDKDSHH